jgi:hypothetical protein
VDQRGLETAAVVQAQKLLVILLRRQRHPLLVQDLAE